MPNYIAQYFKFSFEGTKLANHNYSWKKKKIRPNDDNPELTDNWPTEYRFKAKNDEEAIKKGKAHLSELAEHSSFYHLKNGGYSLDRLLRLEEVNIKKKR